MSSINETAEHRYRMAFDRLKAGRPEVLPVGSPVTQNNVAREAGKKDPSCFKSNRYPILVAEIQSYVRAQNDSQQIKCKQAKKSANKRSLKKQLQDCKAERDKLQSLVASYEDLVQQLEAEINESKSGNVVDIERPLKNLSS